MIETSALPGSVVRLSQRPDGIEIYFPPLRAPAAAVALGLFGAACVALSLLAALGLLSPGSSVAYGLMAIALLGAFAAPFFVFGVVFAVIALYMLANSLTVNVTPEMIRTVRRVFGLAWARRELGCADITAIEAQISAKYQNLFGAEPYFRLVARHATQRDRDLVVAESLRGKAVKAEVQALITHYAGLNPA